MTLLFFDGFQDAALVQKPEWDSLRNFVSATGRDGSTNGAAQHIGTTSTRQLKTLTLPTTAATCIVGFALSCGSNVFGQGAVNTYPIGFMISGTTHLVLMLNASGFLELRLSTGTGTLLASTTLANHTAIGAADWHHFQLKTVLHTSAGSCVVKLDGVTVISYSGQTATASGSVDQVQVISRDSTANNNWYIFDDYWVCDAVDATSTQGRANNDFLGDLKVATLIPSANGDLTAWSKSTGTNAAALVDEVPPNTTDYIFSSTSAQRELMVIPDLPGTAGAVYGVRLNFYALKSDAGASSIKPLVKEVGGTITAQTAKPLLTTAAAYSGENLFTKPSASTTPWTATDVNGLQIGVELA